MAYEIDDLPQCLPGLYSYPVIPARKNHLTAKPVQLIHDLLAIADAEARVLDARFELDRCMGAAAARIEAAEPLSLEWALAWRVYNDLLRQDDELREKEILQNGNKN